MVTEFETDLDELDEIWKTRGTCKGSDYVYLIQDQLKRRAEYSEKGWF